jgi:hypothetical protein
MEQHIFTENGKFYLVDIYEDGRVFLKIKEQGWSDTWSLPLEQVKR